MTSTADSTPDVSFVVIAFNERIRAPQCIRSILHQRTPASFEVLLVDDGSSDGTADAVAVTVGADKRLRIVALANNQGRGAARGVGVEAARGRSIALVDADVTLPRDWLDRCLAELPGNAGVGGIAVPDGDSTVLARISGAEPREVAGSMPITGNNVLFDAMVLREIGFDARDRLGEDFRLAARIQRAGHRLARVPGLTVRHEERESYWKAIRLRFETGVDAATHPRELGRLRFSDLVWLGWCGAWVIGVVGAVAGSPGWLFVGPASGAAAGVLHAATRFKPRPFGRFLVACLADIPLLFAYLVGRTVGAPRLVTRRR